MSETAAGYSPDTRCAVCGGQPHDLHHIEPRGRAPEKRDEPENLAPVCRNCHKLLIPEGQWRVDREDAFWVTTHVETGETISRRPIEPEAGRQLVALHLAFELLDPRDESERFRDLLALAADDDVVNTDTHLSQMGSVIRYGRMLVRHELWLRNPFKDRRCECPRTHTQAVHDVALLCGLAENTVEEDVRAAKFYIADEGKPMPDSFYRAAVHYEAREGEDEWEGLRRTREIFEAGGSVRDVKRSLSVHADEPEYCTCVCGDVHVRKEVASAPESS